nr:MAG TPA: hypothetical protein [Caudoviricetes sp.]
MRQPYLLYVSLIIGFFRVGQYLHSPHVLLSIVQTKFLCNISDLSTEYGHMLSLQRKNKGLPYGSPLTRISQRER